MGGTGALVIADVGQGAWEEIDYEPAGRSGLLLVAALDSRTTQQLAVLLLSHPLASLLDY